MRFKKFDVIAVDELDMMHLEADLTDAIVSADAASKKCLTAFSGLLLTMGPRRTFPKLAAATTTRRTSPMTPRSQASLTTLRVCQQERDQEYVSITAPLEKGVPDHEVRHPVQERSRG